MGTLLTVAVVLAGIGASHADVHFVEEIVNRGFGPQRIGARRTTNEVYIKGARQKVKSTISTSEQTARQLRDQGRSLQTTTILRLDNQNVYEVDLESQTYVQRPVPPAAKPAAKKAAEPASTDPRIRFTVTETGDTTRIAGVLSRRVIARMQARYMDPETGAVRRENRYTYDAWLAADFPGYKEIKAFQQLQEESTSYPPLISGGIQQLQEVVQDSDELEAHLQALEGFPMRSTIRVTVMRPGQEAETEVFRLDRQITKVQHHPLDDTVFQVSDGLSQIKTR